MKNFLWVYPLLLVGCTAYSGLNKALNELGYTALTPPQTGVKVGSIYDIAKSSPDLRTTPTDADSIIRTNYCNMMTSNQ